jgi:hypothetical protein
MDLYLTNTKQTNGFSTLYITEQVSTMSDEVYYDLESKEVREERRRGDMDRRISYLEAAHLDNTNKITSLIKGFNDLNITLTTLTTTINTAVKVILFGFAFASTSLAGLWGYHTYLTAQINHTTTTITRN